MSGFRGSLARTLAARCGLALLSFGVASSAHAYTSLGGFIPFVGIGMTNEFETFDSDPTGLFNLADVSYEWGGSPFGPGSSAYFDVALLDTGAATHILTQQAGGATGFSIQAEGFRGTNFQPIVGAVGTVDLRINDPAGIYAAGLGDRTGAGTALTMDTAAFRGQTSVSTLEAPAEWELPNILGLPMAAQHAISIRNDDPQIFQHQGRTMRTPQVDFIDLGTGGQQGITRRTNLRLRPSASFLTGPLYIQNLEIGGGLEFNFHDNPLSPTVVDSGGLYVEVDLKNGSDYSEQNVEFLFDTGADLTVISEVMAASLGFDVVNDKPDFVLEVEGAGGVSGGVPGFYVEQMKIDAVGGSFILQNVPVAVLDVPNPNDAANVIDAILGMHVFNGRNLVIDATPAAGATGGSPSLYIGDPVSQSTAWASTAASAGWATSGSWAAAGAPTKMWDAQVRNVSGVNQTATVAANSTIYRMTVAGASSARMTVAIQAGATLTTFGEAVVEAGGEIRLQGGKLDAQFINLEGGTLSGSGEIFVGSGPVTGAVRNLSGRIEPGAPVGKLTIVGDLSHLNDGTLAIDLGGTTAATQYDQVAVDRYAFLGGTLEVSLANLGGGTFAPAIGNAFTILTATKGVVGEFTNLVLPSAYQWQVDYQANAVVLMVTGLGSLAGDFNADGSVNAADLAAWKQGFGTLYTGADFLVWQRAMSNGGASAAAAAAPEPAAGGLMLCATVAAIAVKRRRLSI